jgi:glycolate oxidase iron-sulfur subunit
MTKRLDDLGQYYDEVARCSRCGFCQPTCPTYVVTGLETEVARGRNNLVRMAIEGRAGLDTGSMASLDACLRCGACVTACFAGVRTDRIVAAARTHAESHKKAAGAHLKAILLRYLLPQRWFLRMAAKGICLFQESGLADWVKSWEALGGVFSQAARAVALLPKGSGATFYEGHARGAVLPPYGAQKARIAYYAGCRTDALYPQIGRATVEVLRRLGAEVSLMAEPPTCCGLPAYSYGQDAATRAMVERNARAMAALDVDWVVTETGSCYHFLKEHAVLFGDEPEWGAMARAASAKVLYLADAVERLAPGGVPGIWQGKVTFQDSCQLAHLQKIQSSPRRVLASISGLEYKEMENAQSCCGGAGAYTVSHPEMADSILEPKLKKAVDTGAQTLVVACQSCLMHMKAGAQRSGMPMRVLHLAELLDESMHSSKSKVIA